MSPPSSSSPTDVSPNGTSGPRWLAFPGRALTDLRPDKLVPAVERFLRRDEADVVLVVGNIALVAFEVIEWPVAALTLAVHLLARTRYKGLEAMAEVAEESE